MPGLVQAVRLSVDLLVVVVICVSAVIALAGTIRMGTSNPDPMQAWDRIWQRFAVGISFALVFSLVSDILVTVVASGWESIAKLASMGAIFLLLNPFVVRKFQRSRPGRPAGGS